MDIIVNSSAKALIFDLDGTISDSLPVHVATWDSVGNELGFKFDQNLVYELTGRPTIEFAERIINDHNLKTDPKEMVRLKQKAFHNSMDLLKPIDKIVTIIKQYYGKLPMAVGTGASRKSAEMQLKTLGLTQFFETIVTADDVTSHKPEPDTFQKCAQLMGIASSDCQVFEDGDLGIKAAKTAGMLVTDVRPFINYGEWTLS